MHPYWQATYSARPQTSLNKRHIFLHDHYTGRSVVRPTKTIAARAICKAELDQLPSPKHPTPKIFTSRYTLNPSLARQKLPLPQTPNRSYGRIIIYCPQLGHQIYRQSTILHSHQNQTKNAASSNARQSFLYTSTSPQFPFHVPPSFQFYSLFLSQISRQELQTLFQDPFAPGFQDPKP